VARRFLKLTVYPMKKDLLVEEVEVDGLGAAMLAIDARQRRFVVGMIGTGCKNAARVAKAAGYSDSSGAAKVTAHRLMRQPRVIAALREEAERRFDTVAVEALIGLGDLVKSKNPKARVAAIDSVLDRAGYGRRSVQDIRVEHVDSRSTAQILADLQRLMPGRALPVLETTAEPVDASAEA
jgi:hypothetical protein